MATVSMGTLYSLNKTLISKRDPMTKEELAVKMNGIGAWFSSRFKNHYYMLLCRERSDYTVFHILDSHYYEITRDLEEVITGRGEVLAIDYSHENEYYEIWIRIEGEGDEPFLFILFDCDFMIVEG